VSAVVWLLVCRSPLSFAQFAALTYILIVVFDLFVCTRRSAAAMGRRRLHHGRYRSGAQTPHN
jgi:hypothetical protein